MHIASDESLTADIRAQIGQSAQSRKLVAQ